MGGLLVLVAASVFGLSCVGLDVDVTCDLDGVFGLLKLLLAALVANQSVYQATKHLK